MLFIIICLFINSSQIVHMYMHPAVRNIKRRGMDPEEKEKENKWMVDKVLLLRELCEVYKDHSHPNKDINKILTNKIIYQIKYHRRKLKLVGEEVSPQEITVATKEECGPVGPGTVLEDVPRVHRSNNEKSIQEWSLLLERQITMPTEVPPVLREVHSRLMSIWVIYNDFPEALMEQINSFISIPLYEAIRESNAKVESHVTAEPSRKPYKKEKFKEAKLLCALPGVVL